MIKGSTHARQRVVTAGLRRSARGKKAKKRGGLRVAGVLEGGNHRAQRLQFMVNPPMSVMTAEKEKKKKKTQKGSKKKGEKGGGQQELGRQKKDEGGERKNGTERRMGGRWVQFLTYIALGGFRRGEKQKSFSRE